MISVSTEILLVPSDKAQTMGYAVQRLVVSLESWMTRLMDLHSGHQSKKPEETPGLSTPVLGGYHQHRKCLKGKRNVPV
jgi:hypothetical protein